MRKSKIGLAPRPGAAKGCAHKAAINALMQVGIKSDIKAGCSAGARVGAAYACDQLTSREIWGRAFRYRNAWLLMNAFRQCAGPLREARVFNQLHLLASLASVGAIKRFGTAAENLSIEGEFWLKKRDLHMAVRSPCSMPGALASALHNGYPLVDGAAVSPISLTRAPGADIVIADDLQHDAYLKQQKPLSEASLRGSLPDAGRRKLLRGLVTGRATLPSTAMEIMRPSIQVLENRVKRNRMAESPPDILLQPYCPQISTLDFHRAEEAINAGTLTVDKRRDEFLPLVHVND